MGIGRWVDWVGGGYGYVQGMHHACTCTCMHACMHTPTYMLNMINMGASMSVAICNFYTCIHVCVCMYVGTPHMPTDASRHPPHTCPFPRATGSPKHQNSISLELIKIF